MLHMSAIPMGLGPFLVSPGNAATTLHGFSRTSPKYGWVADLGSSMAPRLQWIQRPLRWPGWATNSREHAAAFCLEPKPAEATGTGYCGAGCRGMLEGTEPKGLKCPYYPLGSPYVALWVQMIQRSEPVLQEPVTCPLLPPSPQGLVSARPGGRRGHSKSPILQGGSKTRPGSYSKRGWGSEPLVKPPTFGSPGAQAQGNGICPQTLQCSVGSSDLVKKALAQDHPPPRPSPTPASCWTRRQ